MLEIFNVTWASGSLIVKFSIPVLLGIVASLFLLFKVTKTKRNNETVTLNPVELEVDICGTKTKFNVIRNCQNLYIANRIYIELITRKAALDIDPEEDVIDQVYDSWYKLFGIIREEIKNIPGEYIENKLEKSSQLIGLTIKILNEGLRPHLTKYQADFKKWFNKEQKNNPNESPQKIQKNYSKYEELIVDMQQVNKILYNYAEELKKFIDADI